MLFRDTLLVSLFASVGLGAAIQKRDNSTIYDAIVVGGGPSGLSTLSALARVRRNVLLIDSADYRNAATRVMHDVLGFDGVTPAYYRWAAREQIAFYDTISMTNGTVLKVEAKGTEANSLFSVTTNFTDGSGERVVQARKVVLGTGMRDIIPTTKGVPEAWGKGIYWCPWCDGHEHMDQPLGLLAALPDVPGLVREILTLNTDIVAFTNGTDTEAARAETEKDFPQWETWLEINNVTVYDQKIKAVERLREGSDPDADPSQPSVQDHDLFRVDFEDDDTTVERAAFLAKWPITQASSVGKDMGVWIWGTKLAVNASIGHMTNIPGVYAVGDANSDNSTNVPHALYSGKAAGVYLHMALAREDALTAIAEADAKGEKVKSRRDLELEARDLWEIMNDEEGSPLYAGEFRE